MHQLVGPCSSRPAAAPRAHLVCLLLPLELHQQCTALDQAVLAFDAPNNARCSASVCRMHAKSLDFHSGKWHKLLCHEQEGGSTSYERCWGLRGGSLGTRPVLVLPLTGTTPASSQFETLRQRTPCRPASTSGSTRSTLYDKTAAVRISFHTLLLRSLQRCPDAAHSTMMTSLRSEEGSSAAALKLWVFLWVFSPKITGIPDDEFPVPCCDPSNIAWQNCIFIRLFTLSHARV